MAGWTETPAYGARYSQWHPATPAPSASR